MPYWKLNEVNQGFEFCMNYFREDPDKIIDTQPSRNGEVLSIREPVVLDFEHPTRRVLFHPYRDANPFFHLYEALWMLTGQSDVESLDKFNSNMKTYSDNGENFWGAYGNRWRNWFRVDQLKRIAAVLRENPYDRRQILSMWDPYLDPPKALVGGKDIPCNLLAIPRIEEGDYLNLDVYNRSNDSVWGTFGANYVHFTILQEYLANLIGAKVKVGNYRVITSNLHFYTETFDIHKLAEPCRSSTWDYSPIPLAEDREDFLAFDSNLLDLVLRVKDWKRLDRTGSSFLDSVALPLFNAFFLHKDRDYRLARVQVSRCADEGWRKAAYEWLDKRRTKYERKIPSDNV